MSINSIQLDTAGEAVMATLRVKARRVARVILLIGAGLLSLIFLSILVFSIASGRPGVILFSLVVYGLVMFLILRYVLWNLAGVENITIRADSISYSYRYGFFQTAPATINFHLLRTDLRLIKEESGRTGKLLFRNRDENGMEEDIYEQSFCSVKQI